MKKRNITLLTAIAAAAALAPAAQAQITIMDPTTNDGSFEGYTAGAPVNWGNNHYTGIWTNTSLIGEWKPSDASYKTDGNNCLVVNGGNSGTATSDDLLGTAGYNTVTEGDEFTYSWDYRPNANFQTFKFEIDFGNGVVELESVTTTTERGYQTMSGTYTALAADASGGKLQVSLYQEGHSWTDNVQLSVTSGTPPAADPVITSIVKSGNTVTVNFTGAEDGTFDLNKAASLDGTFPDNEDSTPDSVTIVGTSGTLTDSNADETGTLDAAFYQVKQQ